MSGSVMIFDSFSCEASRRKVPYLRSFKAERLTLGANISIPFLTSTISPGRALLSVRFIERWLGGNLHRPVAH